MDFVRQLFVIVEPETLARVLQALLQGRGPGTYPYSRWGFCSIPSDALPSSQSRLRADQNCARPCPRS